MGVSHPQEEGDGESSPQLPRFRGKFRGWVPTVMGMRIVDLRIPARDQLGNVVCTSVLQANGATPADIRTWVRRGEITRLRQGWYALAEADPDVVRAVRAGGVLGCASALTFYGGWDLHDNRLHSYRTGWAQREPLPRLPSCPAPFPRRRMNRAVVPLELAVAQARLCLTTEQLVTQVESLMTGRWITPSKAAELLGNLAHKLDISDSGTETMVRMRLRGRGIKLRPQVHIPGVGPVDFLIGDRLVLEIDSQAHHRSASAYHRDRQREQRLAAMGYLVIRVTWEQVFFQWDEVDAVLTTLIAGRRHLDRRSRARSAAA